MSEQKAFLEKIHVKNYRSLRNVPLPFKPLTVLVGPNASGKSNTLNALRLFHWILPTTVNFIQDRVWAGGADHITCQLHVEVKKKASVYKLEFKATSNNLSVEEVKHLPQRLISFKIEFGRAERITLLVSYTSK